MGVGGSFVVLVLAWWIAFFTMLPIGVRSQLEEGKIEPGTEPGAPTVPGLGWKVLASTGISIAVWAILFLVIEYNLITMKDLTGK